MLKKTISLFLSVILLGLDPWARPAGAQLADSGAIFDPAPAQTGGWLEAFQALAAWGQTELGQNLFEAQPGLKALTMGLAQNPSEAELSASGPLLRAAVETKIAPRLIQNMGRMAGLAPALQKRNFAQIVKDLGAAGQAAAPEVEDGARRLAQAHSEDLAALSPTIEQLSAIESWGIYGDAVEVKRTLKALSDQETALQQKRLSTEVQGTADSLDSAGSTPGAGKGVVIIPDTSDGKTISGRGAPVLLVPKSPGFVNWQGEQYPTLFFPTDGVSPLELWLKAHAAGDAVDQANYNFDLVDMANAMVAASKKGVPHRLVGDFSNWFPHKLPQTSHGGSYQARTEAMDIIVRGLGPNLRLWITKGLTSIGINHNKFTLFEKTGLPPLGQGGSANYTLTSFISQGVAHWENVGFTLDADRNALDHAYFEWLLRHAKPFSESLTAQDVEPHFDPGDPIPTDPRPSLNYGGSLFPIASYSPNGGTEGWIVKATQLVEGELLILMFSPFFTPPMIAAIADLLPRGKRVALLADSAQGRHAASHLQPLVEKGMELGFISGPNAVLHPGQAFNPESEKMHEKVMIFDGGQAGGLVKGKDSTNTSLNAFEHNFENAKWWQGDDPGILRDHFNFLWAHAKRMDAQALGQIAAASPEEHAAHAAVWLGQAAR